MSLYTIHLRKLLQFCALDERRTLSALRREASQDRRRQEYPDEGGGDFFAPFWSDAKAHVTHGLDLHEATEDRIVRNGRRSRLYPILRDQFLVWWEQELRSTNQTLVPLEENLHARTAFEDLDITVKVDNLLCLQVGQTHRRIIYPYFCESPPLPPRWARVGLWTMSRALENLLVEDMRILDVQRARGFSVATTPLQGDEEQLLTQRCHELIEIWEGILAQA